MLGQGRVSDKCALFSPGSLTICVVFQLKVFRRHFSSNSILVQNASLNKCFQNVPCLRSYHITPSFVDQNKKCFLAFYFECC